MMNIIGITYVFSKALVVLTDNHYKLMEVVGSDTHMTNYKWLAEL